MFEHYDGNTTSTETQPERKPEPSSRRRPIFKVKGRGKAQTKEAQSQNPTTVDGKTWQQSLSPWITLLYVLLLIAAFFVCLWNIAPYEAMVRAIASRFEGSALLGFLLSLPLIGWALSAAGAFVFWVIGALVWATVQLIEVMPLIMTNHPGYVRSILQKYESSPKFRHQSDDPAVVRSLKNFYNRLPLRFLILARRLRGWVYLGDFLICLMVFPPAETLGRFFFLLGTGQWSRLDWGNIFFALVTLFVVEAIVKLILVVSHFRKYLKEANQAKAMKGAAA